jgi:hypothetical protein
MLAGQTKEYVAPAGSMMRKKYSTPGVRFWVVELVTFSLRVN